MILLCTGILIQRRKVNHFSRIFWTIQIYQSIAYNSPIFRCFWVLHYCLFVLVWLSINWHWHFTKIINNSKNKHQISTNVMLFVIIPLMHRNGHATVSRSNGVLEKGWVMMMTENLSYLLNPLLSWYASTEKDPVSQSGDTALTRRFKIRA